MASNQKLSVFESCESNPFKSVNNSHRILKNELFKPFFNLILYHNKSTITKLSIIYFFSFTLLCLAAFISLHYRIPIAKFTRDPLAITGGHPFLGIISNIGAILWSSSAAFCLLSFSILREKQKSADTIGFIGFGGIISLVLLIDDFFMIHERIFPKYFGIHEKLLFILYGLLIILYFAHYIRIILTTEFLYLIFVFLFFGISLAVDSISESIIPMHHLFEDGAKFIGIVSWVSYQFSVCFQELQSKKSNHKFQKTTLLNFND